MKKSSYRITASGLVGAALLCLLLPTAGFAQSYSMRPTCCPKGQCKVNAATFGFSDTNWRQWPLQPRPEQEDAKTIGGPVIPTPPPIVEKPLPHAESVPAKPPASAGATGTISPSGSGSTAPLDSSKTDSGATAGPKTPGPGGPTEPKAQPDVHTEISPRKPDTAPKPEGSGHEPQPVPDILPHSPEGSAPEKPAPRSDTPATEPPKTPDKEIPALKSPGLSPDPEPSPAAKPDEPLPLKPQKDSSLSWRSKDAVAVKAPASRNDLAVQANWNAAIEPEAVGENRLRSARFQQHTAEMGNPLRCALQGYCPVQLQDSDRWVAGNPDFQTSYRGQVFHFSSEAAQKQFEAAPEKYAPAHDGNDIVLAVEESRAVPGSVNHSAVWHGRLYLFSNSESLAKFQADPAGYANGLPQTPLQNPANSL